MLFTKEMKDILELTEPRLGLTSFWSTPKNQGVRATYGLQELLEFYNRFRQWMNQDSELDNLGPFL